MNKQRKGMKFEAAKRQCEQFLIKLQQLPDDNFEIKIHEWNLLMEKLFKINRLFENLCDKFLLFSFRCCYVVR